MTDPYFAGLTTLVRAAFAFLLSSAPPDGARAGREITVALDGIPEGATCPPPATLARALDARLPGITAPAPEAQGRERLRLQLDDRNALEVRFSLVDVDGRAVLERSLSVSGGGRTDRERAGACAVVAETIALVVERYLRQLGYRAPEPRLADETAGGTRSVPVATDSELAGQARAASAPGHTGLLLAAGIGLGAGRDTPARIEPEVTADWRWRRVALSARAALIWPAEVPVTATGRGRFRYAALPLRAGVGVPISLPRALGWVAGFAAGGVDLYRAEALDVAVSQQVQGAAPVVELGVGAAIFLGARFALRPHAALSLRRTREFRLSDAAPTSAPLFVDPAISLSAGIDLAVGLGKN